MRAVLDVNVLISAALSRSGAPAELIRRWRRGEFELIASPALLAELDRALAYPKVARVVAADDAAALIGLLRSEAESFEDPAGPPPVSSVDSGDDYLIALSADCKAALVSGDKDLLDLGDDLPVYSPAGFLQLLSAGDPSSPSS